VTPCECVSNEQTVSGQNGKVRRLDGKFVKSGEIRSELDSLMKKHIEDIENQRRKEADASSEFIKKLQVRIWESIKITALIF